MYFGLWQCFYRHAPIANLKHLGAVYLSALLDLLLTTHRAPHPYVFYQKVGPARPLSGKISTFIFYINPSINQQRTTSKITTLFIVTPVPKILERHLSVISPHLSGIIYRID